jgi:hypothetical protein
MTARIANGKKLIHSERFFVFDQCFKDLVNSAFWLSMTIAFENL